MREKIGILAIGLLLLIGMVAAVPVNAATSGNVVPLAVDSVVDINSTEDTTSVVNLTEYFDSGWYNMSVSNNENFTVNISGVNAYITPLKDWNGNDSFVITAHYYSVSPPPGNTIRSDTGDITYSVQFNMHVAAVNDPPYVKADAPVYYKAYGNCTTLYDLHMVFGDVDNYYLTYAGQDSNPGINVNVDGSKMQLSSVGDYYGVSTLTLSASDGEYTTTYQVKVYATPDYNMILDEDTTMIMPISDYLPDGWYSLDVQSTDGITADFDNDMNAVVVGTQQNWNGAGFVELTAQYYTVPQPPGNTLRSDSELTVDVPVTVMPVNDPPYIKQSVRNIVSFNEDTKLSVNLYDYFGDVDNSVLYFTAVSTSPSVSASVDDSGILTLVPAHDWDGQFGLHLSASDGEATAYMNATLQVSPTPDIFMKEDTSDVMNLCDYFNEGWSSMSVETDGNISVSIDGDNAYFIPLANWNGEDNITFTATYSSLQPSSSRLPPYFYKVSKVADVRVAPVNDPPFVKSCFPSYVQMSEDGVITANLYHYFGDIDSPDLQFTASSTEGHLSFDIDQNGDITVKPEANWSGYTDMIITAFDGEFATSASTVMGISPSPDLTMKEDTPAEINLNDYFDPGWASINVTYDNGNNIDAVVDSTNGTILLNPHLNWNGYESMEITARYTNYVIFGDSIASAPGYTTVTKKADIVVEPVNDPPVQIKALPDLSTLEDTPMTIDLNDYFYDVDSPLSYTVTTGAGVHTTFDVSTGLLTVTPCKDWNGDTSINILVSDGQYSLEDTKMLKVAPVDDPPVQVKPLPEFQMNEDGRMVIDLNDYFYDVDSPLNFSAVAGGQLDVSISDNGTATIVPSANWNGEAAINITVSDGQYSIKDMTVLDVRPVNDPPVQIAQLPELQFNEDGMAFVDLDDYFGDIDSVLSFSATAGPGLSVKISPVTHVMRVTAGLNWNGDSDIDVVASDGEFSTGQDMGVRVMAVDDAPTILKNPAVICGEEDSVIAIDLDDYFSDVDSVLTYSWNAPESLNVSMAPDSHVLTIVPRANWYGKAVITITASDGTYSKTIRPTISLKGVEDAPEILRTDNMFPGRGGQEIKVDLSSLFMDPDADALTYTVTALNGTELPYVLDQDSNTLVITPPADAQGIFGFVVTASDGLETNSTEVYAAITPSSTGGMGGTEAGVSPAMSDGAVLVVAIASSAALVGMLVYHTFQYRKYENRKRDAML